MCGISGGSFNRRIDSGIINKLKILSLFNQSRGKEAWGYYNGIQIYKGVGEFGKAIMRYGMEQGDGVNNVFISHARKASVGKVEVDNSHPFKIGEKLIIAHNGTIDNIWDLCEKHGIDDSKIFVDSEALGHLLVKCQHKVLEEYKGAAALALAPLTKPNTLYLYHGKSKKWESIPAEEERPLFMMYSEEGMYFSSMKEPLEIIREKNDSSIEEVPHNQVITFVNGVQQGEPVIIDRGDCNIVTYYNWPKTNYAGSNFHTDYSKSPPAVQKTIPFKTSIENGEIDIQTETTKTAPPDRLYFCRGKYHINGIRASGILIVNKKTGQKCEKSYDSIEMCFYKGIWIDNILDYNKILNAESTKNTPLWQKIMENPTQELSKYTKYPICSDLVKTHYYLKGEIVKTKSITPKFSNRIYQYANGKLMKIIDPSMQIVDKNEKPINVDEGKIFISHEDSLKDSTFDPDILAPLILVHFTTASFNDAMCNITRRALEFYFEDVANYHLETGCSKQLIDQLIDELINEAVNIQVPLMSLLLYSEENSEAPIKTIAEYLIDAGEEQDILNDLPETDNMNEDSDPDTEPNEEDKLFEDEKACELCNPIIDKIHDLRKVCNELNMLENSTIACTLSSEILNGCDSLLRDIGETYRMHGKTIEHSMIKKSLNIDTL